MAVAPQHMTGMVLPRERHAHWRGLHAREAPVRCVVAQAAAALVKAHVSSAQRLQVQQRRLVLLVVFILVVLTVACVAAGRQHSHRQ
eukprot:357241-Chlamydomonas_euryale.AAC.14